MKTDLDRIQEYNGNVTSPPHNVRRDAAVTLAHFGRSGAGVR